MPLAQLLGLLRALPLQVRELGFLLLDELVRQNRRERVERRRVALDRRRQLPVHRFLQQAVGLGLGHRAVEIGQLLHHDVLAICDRQRVGLLAVVLQRGFGRFDLRALLLELLGEPCGRVARRRKAELEVLLDVGLGDPVGDLRRDHGILRPEAHLDQPAVANRRDVEPIEEVADRLHLHRRFPGLRNLTRRLAAEERYRPRRRGAHRVADREPFLRRVRAQLRVAPELQRIDRLLRQAPALQQPVLRLVVVLAALRLVDDFLEVHDVRVVCLDQQLDPPFVEGRRRERVHGGGQEDRDEHREGDVSALDDHARVVEQMRLLARLPLVGTGTIWLRLNREVSRSSQSCRLKFVCHLIHP